MNLLITFGTRPEWIKIKPVIDKIDGIIPYKILYTGQHSTLIDSSFEKYRDMAICINPEDDCDIRLDSIVSSILKQIPSNMYDATHVMVQGDTSTALAVALAAFHRQIPVIHLEAGLRTHDIGNPFPEESNRAMISEMASIHLCPTSLASLQLSRKKNVYVVGNTVLDSIDKSKPITTEDLVLVTMHRRENLCEIKDWFEAIEKEAQRSNNLFVFPMHPNPEIQKHKDIFNKVKVIDPIGRDECLDIIRRCKYVITDSGGIQEEASFLKKKCLVCRKSTERSEGLGSSIFLCSSPLSLSFRVSAIENSQDYIVKAPCPFGNGNASDLILGLLIKEMTRNK